MKTNPKFKGVEFVVDRVVVDVVGVVVAVVVAVVVELDRDGVVGRTVVEVGDSQWYRVQGNRDLISRIGQSTGYLSTSAVNFINIYGDAKN